MTWVYPTAATSSNSDAITASNDHSLDALDDDFSRDVARSPPPGFAKIVPPNESADAVKVSCSQDTHLTTHHDMQF